MITTMAAVRSVVIGIGDDSYDVLNDTTEGIEVVRESNLSLTVTLSDAFFRRQAGRQPSGNHPRRGFGRRRSHRHLGIPSARPSAH